MNRVTQPSSAADKSKLPQQVGIPTLGISTQGRFVTQPYSLTILLFALVAIATSSKLYAADLPANLKQKAVEVDTDARDRRCEAVKDVASPANEFPKTRRQSEADSCGSLEMYYTTRDSVSPSQGRWDSVRLCAAQEGELTILTMLYANGEGVKKNLPLALHYACVMEEQDKQLGLDSSEPELMMDALQEMIAGQNHGKLDFCDYAGGPNEALCAGFQEGRDARKREIRLNAYSDKFHGPEKSAFDKMMAAFREFASDRGSIETDQMPTGRTINGIIASDDEWNALLSDLDALAQGRELPTYTATSAANVDKRLNAIYREVMSSKPLQQDTERVGDGTLTKADVRKTERAWLAYRDAWVKFCAVSYPHADPVALTSIVTERRAAKLEEMHEMGDM